MGNRLCFLSAHLPSPISRQAGQKIAYNHLKWLSSKYDIILISFANKDEIETYRETDYSFCKEKFIIEVNCVTRIKGVLNDFSLPVIIATRYDEYVRKWIAKLWAETDSVFWLEYVQMCQYIPSENKEKHRVITVCHDILNQMYERKCINACVIKLLYFYEKRRVEIWENTHLKKSNELITLSVKDKTLLLDYYGIKNVKVCYPQLSINSTDNFTKIISEEKNIVFFGAMNRIENESAVCDFIKNIWGHIIKHIPNAKLYIVGASPSVKVKKLSNSNIIITGFIDNPYKKIFSKAWFSIAPLTMGAGIKLKVLECMASGLPIISSAIGAEGIEASADDGLIIAHSKEEYIEHILQLMSDKEKCFSLGVKAMTWINNIYSPNMENDKKILKIAMGD